jgi:hypothetical protein
VPAKTIAAATPGQQYLPVDETVTFQPGQTALTVSVPIVPNAANPGIVLVEMTTTPLVTGGTAENGYFAILSGPDQLPLTINSAQIVPQASGASAIALTFNEPMAQASVESLQNYRITPLPAGSVVLSPASGSREPASSHGSLPPNSLLTLPGRIVGGVVAPIAFLAPGLFRWAAPKISHVPPIPLQSATYDAATNTVTLVTTKPLNPSRRYQVAIGSGVGTPRLRKHNPAIGGDLTSQAGNSLTPFGGPPLPIQQLPGGNLVDLSLNPIHYFTASPTSFNVSSRPSGPLALAPFANAPIKYSFDL